MGIAVERVGLWRAPVERERPNLTSWQASRSSLHITWMDCVYEDAVAETTLAKWTPAHANPRHFTAEQMMEVLGHLHALSYSNIMGTPDPRAIDRAILWTVKFFRAMRSMDLPWLPPHVTVGLRGEIEFEWWNSGRSLTIYFSPDRATFLESWGPDMDADMEEGDADSDQAQQQAWSRLVGG